MVEVEFAN